MTHDKWVELIDHQIKLNYGTKLNFPQDFNEKEQLQKRLEMAIKLLEELK